MRQVNTKRYFGDDKETLSVLTTANGRDLFTCKVLELGWHENQNNISCVPKGNYTCKWTRSNRMSSEAGHDVFTYEVMNVPSRAGVRIHSSNYYTQLRGCLALGDTTKDINGDGEEDVTNSVNTVKSFVAFMNKEDFILIIE